LILKPKDEEFNPLQDFGLAIAGFWIERRSQDFGLKGDRRILD
jgi:hypothetical protein